ncbi:isopentenyl-diphosphate Delta-isomerase [Ensifer sp. IC3342]|nr:isopentenyl-diphosphate Delta-isomerase [Ensifer sp. BRP08]MCA1451414.1 isopentenyl-diphosphate Delta-isomerase [Ensifer sp. IC3342]
MNIAMDVPSEMVILCNVHGEAIGTAPKSEIHHAQTPLHLAFSVYIFNAENKLLVTRRASDKITWPGVLTNSCCGHPRPGEPLTEAVERRAREELGIDVDGIRLVLPEFSYCATMGNGITEHELCPVFTARCQTLSVTPDLSEVSAWEWADWQWFLGSVQDGRLTVSPWCRAQVELLEALGADPSQWPTADDLRLPEAARVSIQEVGPTAAHCTGAGT